MKDLNDLIPDKDTITVEIKFKGEVLKNDDDSPMTVEVYLPHTKEYKKAKHDQADVVINKGKEKFTSAEYEQMGIDLLSKITKSWNITMGGKNPKLTIAKAKEVYEKFPIVGEQVQEALETNTAFM